MLTRAPKLQTLLALITSLAMVTPAMAGIDTLVQFTNLSPYQATIEFPQGESDCWHNTPESDNRIKTYFDYYRRNAASAESYQNFLAAYKHASGIDDFSTIPTYSMANTSVTLVPAVAGNDAGTVLFKGETSAELFGGCKLATSSRGFRIKLTDSDGTELSHQKYVLTDPPDDRWTLSQMRATSPKVVNNMITLGSGGHGNPWEIGLAAATTALTVISVGQLAYSAVTARAALQGALGREAATLASQSQTLAAMTTSQFLEYASTSAGQAVVARVTQGVGTSAIQGLWSRVFTYALHGTAAVGASEGALVWAVANYARNTVFRYGLQLAFFAVLDGTVIIAGSHDALEPAVRMPDGTVFDAAAFDVDFESPSLVRNASLPADASICAHHTRTLGLVTECRVVGISLTIMPDGSLTFMPLPSVGYGRAS